MSAAGSIHRLCSLPAAHAARQHAQNRPCVVTPSYDIRPARARDCVARGVSDVLITEETARTGFAPPKEAGSVAGQARMEQRAVAEKLIAAFQGRPKSEWRRLITFSKKWPQLAPAVFSRCRARNLAAVHASRHLLWQCEHPLHAHRHRFCDEPL